METRKLKQFNIKGIMYYSFVNLTKEDYCSFRWNLHIQFFRFVYLDLTRTKYSKNLILTTGLLSNGSFNAM